MARRNRKTGVEEGSRDRVSPTGLAESMPRPYPQALLDLIRALAHAQARADHVDAVGAAADGRPNRNPGVTAP